MRINQLIWLNGINLNSLSERIILVVDLSLNNISSFHNSKSQKLNFISLTSFVRSDLMVVVLELPLNNVLPNLQLFLLNVRKRC